MLALIFSFLSCDYSNFPSLLESPYQHMVVARVCSKWRTIALSNPHFWTIYLGPPTHVAAFLQYSGEALVDIVSGFQPIRHLVGQSNRFMPKIYSGPFLTSSRLVAESVELIQAQFHRVKSLTLAIPSHILKDIFHALESGLVKAPALRKIVLSSKGGGDLPIHIFSPHSLPILSHLELCHYRFACGPTLHQFTTLETIIIRNPLGLGSSSCIAHGLIPVLHNNPRLKVVCIRDDFCPDGCLELPLPSHPELPLVSLPYLSRIMLHLDMGCINFLLTHLVIPHSAITDIRPSDPQSNSPQCSPAVLKSIASHLARKYSEIAGFELTFQGTSISFPYGIEHRPLYGSRISFEICHPDSSETSQLVPADERKFIKRDRFELVVPLDDGWIDAIKDIIFLLPLAGIKYLGLAISYAYFNIVDPYVDIMAYVIRRCCSQGIQVLNVDGMTLSLIPTILASLDPDADVPSIPQMPERGDGLSRSALFRSLRTLIVNDVYRGSNDFPNSINDGDDNTNSDSDDNNNNNSDSDDNNKSDDDDSNTNSNGDDNNTNSDNSDNDSNHDNDGDDSDYDENNDHTVISGIENTLDAVHMLANQVGEVGICPRFSKLILQNCYIERAKLYELVDCVADIVHQRGRFTSDPPAPYTYLIPHSRPRAHKPVSGDHDTSMLPDADLDGGYNRPAGAPSNHSGSIDPEPKETPILRERWDEYVGCRRVTFDFRGSSGIQVDLCPSRAWKRM